MDFFTGDYISALRREGGCTVKFLYALQIDQGYLAHTPNWDGGSPQKNLIMKIKNLA